MMDNGPARDVDMTKEMVTAGDNIADIVEVRTMFSAGPRRSWLWLLTPLLCL